MAWGEGFHPGSLLFPWDFSDAGELGRFRSLWLATELHRLLECSDHKPNSASYPKSFIGAHIFQVGPYLPSPVLWNLFKDPWRREVASWKSKFVVKEAFPFCSANFLEHLLVLARPCAESWTCTVESESGIALSGSSPSRRQQICKQKMTKFQAAYW